MAKNEPLRFVEKRTSNQKDVVYRQALEAYFSKSSGSNIEKLFNFCKYVPRQELTRFISRYEIFKMVLNVQGSVIECGVLFGGSLMTWAQLSAILEPVNHQRKIIGFDTFKGFSSLSKEDKKGRSEFLKKGKLAVDSYNDLKKSIELYDMNRNLGHIEKVILVRGDINITVPKYIKGNPYLVVSLLYLDVDIFKPTRTALKYFLSRMPKGAVLVFDELNSDNWPGETEAVMQEVGLNKLRIRRFSFDTHLSYAIIE
ncbi:MAG: dTDP-6-deoxy-L-hexose 3-O-methyltransferase [Nitrospirae bacterium RBG_13_41_22]|nr:MAG: dTDP-6-deoxy-L-hexose 3-O-methyltransferase [Nitrospirae bacterium RBG_13_41_22]